MHFKDKRNSLTIIRASTIIIIIILTSLSFLLTFSQLHLVYVHGQEQTTGRQQAQQHIFINNVTDTKNDTVPNEYIVVLKDNTTDTPASIAKELQTKGTTVLHIYEHAIKGFAIKIGNQTELNNLKNDSRVAYIEQVRIFHAS
ncbi:MAG TPA: protease inhibitor I9 family protein [Nitrososphaeraceae archaeon]|jgi:hypothetical protein|nr:protease inhibitor I9 family protein [Nitrososphaeraceae archaeon]